MNRKDYVRILRKILAIVIIFSMLQGHVGVIGTFGHVAYAAIESSLEEVFEETASVETENVVTEETPVVEKEEEFNQSLTTEEPEKVTEEKTEEETTEEVTDQVVENTILENVTSNPVVPEDEVTEEEEVVAEEEEEIVEEVETLNSEINIVNSYRYLDGVIVRAEFNNTISNLKHVVESLKVNISKPQVEGYVLDQIYVERLDLASDDSIYSFYENTNGITIDVSGEDAIDECSHKYTIVYVFKGAGEFKNLSFNIDTHVTYKDLVQEEYFSSISSEITEEVESDETENVEETEEVIDEESKTDEMIEGNADEISLDNVGGEFNVLVHTYTEEELANFVKELDLNTSKDVAVEIKDKVINEYLISTQNASIYKGYLYANAISEPINQTTYTSVYNLNLKSRDNIYKIVVREDSNDIVSKDSTRIDLSNRSEFVKSTVNVEKFKTIFGEYGYIKIVSNGNVIGKIARNTLIEGDSFVFYYPENISNVEFVLESMENIGELEIVNTKIIKEDAGFTREEVSNFEKIETEISVTEYTDIDNQDFGLYVENKNLEISLEDTESKMDVLVSTDTLSTSTPNDVTFTVTLRTDEEKYELFKNPYFEIRLPSDVSDVQINTVNLLYKNGLSIDRYDVVTDEFGNKAIRVNLIGTQREYTPGLPSAGSTVTIYATITLDRLTTNQESKYEFRYDNQAKSNIAYEVEGKDHEDIPVYFVSKQGLLRALSLTNENTLESIISYDNESTELLVKQFDNSQVIKYKGTIVNNFNTDLTDVVIIGKIPSQGAVDGNNNQLESTFDMTLNSPIATTGLVSEVYYSTNINADKDSISWEKDVTNLNEYKAFKIVIENETVKQGESLEFSLNMNVPNNLDYNNKAYATYTVYYCLNGQELTGTSTDKVLTEEKEMTIDDFSDEEIDEVATLSFTTSASQGGTLLTDKDTVFERQIVDYTVYVKNTSNVPAKNVKIKADVHNSNLYYKYIFESDEYDLTNKLTYFYYQEDIDNSKQIEEFTIDTLAPGETASFTYQCVTDEISDDTEKEVYSSIKVSADDIEEQSIETMKNKIKNTKVSLKLEWAYRQIIGDKDVTSGDGLKYRIYYKNISNETLKNQIVYFTIPNTVKYTGEVIEGAEKFNKEEIETSEGMILAIEVPEIKAGEEMQFFIPLIANDFSVDVETVDLSYLAYTMINEDKVKSNKYTHTCYQDKTTIEYTFNADKTQGTVLKDGDIVTYTLIVRNAGKIDVGYLGIKSKLPNGLSIEEIKYTKNNETKQKELTNKNQLLITDDSFKVNEEIKVELVTKFQKDYLLYDQKNVEVQMAIEGGSAFDIENTNIISFEVENDKVTVDEEEIIDGEGAPEGEDVKDTIAPPPITMKPEEENKEDIIDDNKEQTDNKEESKDDASNNNNNNNDNNLNNNDNSNNDNNSNNNNNTNNNINNNNNVNNNNNNNSNTSNGSTNNNQGSGTTSNTQKQPTVTTKKTYRISGKAWLDKNKDGKYESGEELLKGISVTAYSVGKDGKVENGIAKGTTKTSTDGTYVFAGLENGNYILVFGYDIETYSPTQYEAKDVPTAFNSDVISKKMSKTNDKVAMTDTLEIKDSTLTNIDIGLILNNEFDLSVSKYVERAIVSNSKGNKETEFDRDALVKLEIHSKMFESSKVKVVYKIVVENKGEIDGFVNEITDIMPKGTTFKAEENKGWSQKEDGKLVYTGLIGKTIKAGERKEVTLVLHSDDNTVATKQLENNVELTGISNEKGQDDIDTDNNKGKVVLLVIPSTGTALNNIFKVIGIIAVIAAVVLVIVNRDKFKRNYK